MDSEGRSLEERTETINKVFYDAATHEHIANVKTMLAKVRGVDVNMTWGPRFESSICSPSNNLAIFIRLC